MVGDLPPPVAWVKTPGMSAESPNSPSHQLYKFMEKYILSPEMVWNKDGKAVGHQFKDIEVYGGKTHFGDCYNYHTYHQCKCSLISVDTLCTGSKPSLLD